MFLLYLSIVLLTFDHLLLCYTKISEKRKHLTDRTGYWAIKGSIFTDFWNLFRSTKYFHNFDSDVEGNWDSEEAIRLDMSNAGSTKITKQGMMLTMMIDILVGLDNRSPSTGAETQGESSSASASVLTGAVLSQDSYLDCDFAW